MQAIGIVMAIAGSVSVLNRKARIFGKMRNLLGKWHKRIKMALARFRARLVKLLCGDNRIIPGPAELKITGSIPLVTNAPADPDELLRNIPEMLAQAEARNEAKMKAARESDDAEQARDTYWTLGGAIIAAFGFVIEHLPIFQQ
jgi:hypothetical protein